MLPQEVQCLPDSSTAAGGRSLVRCWGSDQTCRWPSSRELMASVLLMHDISLIRCCTHCRRLVNELWTAPHGINTPLIFMVHQAVPAADADDDNEDEDDDNTRQRRL